MSLKPIDVIRKEILMQDFLYTEITKRHIEEYDEAATKQIINIKNDFFSKFTDINLTNFYNGLSQSLDMYDFEQKGLKFIASECVRKMFKVFPELDYHKNDFARDYMEILLPISEKYDINALDILFPIDMKSIIDEYPANFYLPPSSRFKKNNKDSFFTINHCDSIRFLPTVGQITESDVDAMKYQIVINKIINRLDITTNEQEFINIFKKHKSNDVFRIDSFIKFMFGMLIWDKMKNGIDTSDISNIYATFLKRTNPKQCEGTCIKDKRDCMRKDTCERFIRESFRITSISIKQCEIHHSKYQGPAIKPNCPQLVPRYPVSGFLDGHFTQIHS